MIRLRDRIEDFHERDGNEQLTLAPVVAKHLKSDDDGNSRLSRLNTRERKVGTNQTSMPTPAVVILAIFVRHLTQHAPPDITPEE